MRITDGSGMPKIVREDGKVESIEITGSISTSEITVTNEFEITDELIEKVARQICTNLGVDPETEVCWGYGDDMTPAEWQENVGDAGGFIPDIALQGPRWRLYRPKAALEIASHHAVAVAMGSS